MCTCTIYRRICMYMYIEREVTMSLTRDKGLRRRYVSEQRTHLYDIYPRTYACRSLMFSNTVMGKCARYQCSTTGCSCAYHRIFFSCNASHSARHPPCSLNPYKQSPDPCYHIGISRQYSSRNPDIPPHGMVPCRCVDYLREIIF